MSSAVRPSDASGVARRIDHVAMATHDADAAAEWYVTTLGMRVVGDEIVGAAGVRLVYLAPHDLGPDDSTMVQLAQPVADGNVKRFLESHGEGFHHLCFTVDAIDDFLHVRGQRTDTVFRGGRDRLACFLTAQPQGVLIELTETSPMASTSPIAAGGRP